MARTIERLSQAEVGRLIADGVGKAKLHNDGAGLGLRITPTGAASWTLRYTMNGRTTEMGLGSATSVTLAQARKLAKTARADLRAGKDAVAERKAARTPAPVEVTFEGAAVEYIKTKASGWTSPVHAFQWTSSLSRYVYPAIGDKPASDITVADVAGVLKSVWAKKAETANRVRARIEKVLDFAAAQRGAEAYANPARLKGPLEHLLPGRQRSERHYDALPYADIPGFLERLRQRGGMAARSLEWIILTASRSMEARGATWREIDLARRLWTIPAARMKARDDHMVPLSDAAVAALRREFAEPPAPSALVFPGSTGRPLSDVALSKIAKQCSPSVPITVHGFRSTFRGWAAVQPGVSWAVCEHALAHKVAGVPGAYLRPEDTLTARRVLLSQWADYVDGTPTPLSPVEAVAAFEEHDDVVPLRRSA